MIVRSMRRAKTEPIGLTTPGMYLASLVPDDSPESQVLSLESPHNLQSYLVCHRPGAPLFIVFVVSRKPAICRRKTSTVVLRKPAL